MEVPATRHWTSYVFPTIFEHVSVEQGLSQSTVHWIVQDRQGFLWLGTDAGLNRYDGNRFLVLHPDKQNKAGSLGGNRILCILEDHRGLLWVATDDGLTCIDPLTMEIHTYRGSKNPGSLLSNAIRSLAEDHSGNLWIGASDTSICMLPKAWKPGETPRFRSFRTMQRNGTSASMERLHAMYVDRLDRVWIGSNVTGLWLLSGDPSERDAGFIRLAPDSRNPEASAPSQIGTILEDSLGTLWLGGLDGLFSLDPSRKIFRRHSSIPGNPYTLGSNLVMKLNLDRSGNVWVCSDGAGVYKMLPRQSPDETPRFQCFRHDPKDPSSLSSNGIQFFFEDRSGVIWISAYQAGLNKLVLNPGRTKDREKPALFQYRNNPSNPRTLTGNMVSAIGEDRFGNLWIGTDGFGVNRALASSPTNGPLHFDRYLAQPGKAGALQGNVIENIHQDASGQLWMGSYMAGLIRVDQSSPSGAPRFTHFRNNPKDPQSLSSDYIRCIADDGKGRLWIGTGRTGLNLFDPKTHKAKQFALGKDGRLAMRANPEILALAVDSYGTLWMATWDGLNRLNPQTGECRGYVADGPEGLSDSSIHTLHIDASGNLWVGTSGGGLNKTVIPPWFGPEPRFVSYGLKEGLPSAVIRCIQEDDRGQLWLSTDRYLCRFDPKSGKGFPFIYQTELARSEFIRNACFRSPSGEMFFGGNDGLTLFHPDDIAYNPIPPSIVLTDFQVLNTSLPLSARMTSDAMAAGKQEITLSPQDTMVSFKVAALHFAAPLQNQYTYLMEGLDRSWNTLEKLNQISYTTLPSGNYVLRVKGSNCDGIWGDAELRLGIHVLPPWYKTWWLRTLLFGGATIGLFLGIRWYLTALRRRNQFLEKALTEQAQRLHESETLNALTHLTETAANAGENIKQWVSEMAQEVCRAIDASQVNVWENSGELLLPITDTMERPAASVQDLIMMQGADVIPILGPQGETLAVVKIAGKVSAWTPLESQLMASFIHHLGGAYHLKVLRQTLLDTRQQKALDRKTLAAQGQGVLQLCPTCKRCYDETLETCPDDGAILTSPRLLPFRLLGRYRLERLLGEGGTAHVFAAWDEKLDRSVAVKAIKPGNFLSDQARERFSREASLLARLEHPGIVSIYDSRELEDGTVFLVMERLQGMTVGRMIRQYGPARPRQAAFLLRQVTAALASTHAKGLVHRDLKPENLFAMAGGERIRYKVLDFGLAKADLAETGFTQTGMLMGTPNYMSPEQARAQTVDWRSDLYNLAAILYEILSGKALIRSRVLADIFLEIISRDPVPLSALVPGCPPEVESLIHHGLAKDPKQRPEELLAWAGRLDVALQDWNRDIPGWPDQCEENTYVAEIPQTEQTSEISPPTWPGR